MARSNGPFPQRTRPGAGPRRLAAFQNLEFTQINRRCADRRQVGVEEGVVAELILGIVVDNCDMSASRLFSALV